MTDSMEPGAREMTPSEQFWHRVWGQHWPARTIFAKRFWNEPFKDYPQTWYYMPHWKPMRSFLQGLCWFVCRHENSKTEWGYGGGDMVDNWCRWCNKVIKVPISEARFRHPTFNEWRPDKSPDFAPERQDSGLIIEEVGVDPFELSDPVDTRLTPVSAPCAEHGIPDCEICIHADPAPDSLAPGEDDG